MAQAGGYRNARGGRGSPSPKNEKGNLTNAEKTSLKRRAKAIGR